MSSDLAIVCGEGDLPVRLARANPDALCITFAGNDHDMEISEEHCYEKLGDVFLQLQAQKIKRVVMAGSMHRPALNPKNFDSLMREIAPQLEANVQQGDDGLLRFIIKLFESRGFEVCGAHHLLPDLTVSAGVFSLCQPGSQQAHDIDKGLALLRLLSKADIGQSTVVEQGLCLGIETLQGTDALLDFVAKTPKKLRRPTAGVLVKAPKAKQDLRVDLPAIGPNTVRCVARAGLAGIAIAAKKVLLLEPERTHALVAEHGLFLVARDI